MEFGIEMWSCHVCEKYFFVEIKDREELKICPYCEYHGIYPTYTFTAVPTYAEEPVTEE